MSPDVACTQDVLAEDVVAAAEGVRVGEELAAAERTKASACMFC